MNVLMKTNIPKETNFLEQKNFDFPIQNVSTKIFLLQKSCFLENVARFYPYIHSYPSVYKTNKKAAYTEMDAR